MLKKYLFNKKSLLVFVILATFMFVGHSRVPKLIVLSTSSFRGPITLEGTSQSQPTITSNLVFTTSTTPFFFRSTTSATSGTQNNLRARVQATAASAATGEDRAIYAQAVTNASLNGGTLTGVFANYIAKNASVTVTGRAIFAEAETEATATSIVNLYGIYVRTKAHLDPTTDYYGVMIDNEQLSTGFQTDAYLGMKSTTWTTASATYGIDMNGINTLATADIRFHNGEILSNVTDGVLDAAAAEFQSSTLNFADATAVAGTGDVITVDFIPDLTIVIGTQFSFIAEAANTTNATMNVDSGGANALEEYNGAQSALDANDIRSGQIVEIQWNGTQWVMLSATGN